MHWNQIDKRLQELYNNIGHLFNEQTPYMIAEQANTRMWKLLEELTNELKLKQDYENNVMQIAEKLGINTAYTLVDGIDLLSKIEYRIDDLLETEYKYECLM